MRKTMKFIFVICFLMLLFCLGSLIADKQSLRTQIVRLHVIGNSNSIEDQMVKLAVKDAVISRLGECLDGVNNISDAKELIKKNLPNIKDIANRTLLELGSEHVATVTLSLEEFNRRDYETFSLPAGVYESLRIQIGSGQGRNWWCVAFPAFCTPSTTDRFQTTAVSGGFNQGLAKTLSNEPSYEVRFFLLDCLGKIENFLIFS